MKDLLDANIFLGIDWDLEQNLLDANIFSGIDWDLTQESLTCEEEHKNPMLTCNLIHH